MNTLPPNLGVACLALAILFNLAPSAQSRDDGRVLFDFETPAEVSMWRTVNDGVMGGVSDGRRRFGQKGCIEFFGTLSLDNNGGFASVRSRPAELHIIDGDMLVARVHGDGRRYCLNLYVPTYRTAFSYRAPFQTEVGKWQEIRIPLTDFRATSFGRQIPQASPVDPGRVHSLGFLLADKVPGDFRLKIDWIRVESGESH